MRKGTRGGGYGTSNWMNARLMDNWTHNQGVGIVPIGLEETYMVEKQVELNLQFVTCASIKQCFQTIS